MDIAVHVQLLGKLDFQGINLTFCFCGSVKVVSYKYRVSGVTGIAKAAQTKINFGTLWYFGADFARLFENNAASNRPLIGL